MAVAVVVTGKSLLFNASVGVSVLRLFSNETGINDEGKDEDGTANDSNNDCTTHICPRVFLVTTTVIIVGGEVCFDDVHARLAFFEIIRV